MSQPAELWCVEWRPDSDTSWDAIPVGSYRERAYAEMIMQDRALRHPGFTYRVSRYIRVEES